MCALIALGLLAPAGQALADEDELYKTKNCFACHRVDRNHLGPSFKSIAAKYADQQGIDAQLARKVREGSVGVWGPVPMPAQPQVSEAEALTLTRWILTRK
ncbi:MAG: c-type cytochrome [Burkholderiaceae bacterium]|nr:c-type cytochrome [Burkholderiaceae bacterium]